MRWTMKMSPKDSLEEELVISELNVVKDVNRLNEMEPKAKFGLTILWLKRTRDFDYVALIEVSDYEWLMHERPNK